MIDRGPFPRLALCAALLVGSAPVLAAPTVRQVTLGGVQAGVAATLTIDGEDLLPDSQVVLPVPLTAQEVQPGGNAKRIVVKLTIAADAPAGIYPLRVVNRAGISNSYPLAVDRLPQQPFAESLAELPAALHGNLTGGATLRTRFQGRAGMPLVVEVESKRLASSLDPVLHVYDSGGRQIGWAQPTLALFGDCRVVARLPADGEYTITLHDAQYAGKPPGRFRLKVGDLQFADRVFPLAVQRQSSATLQLVGNIAAPVAWTAESSSAVAAAPWPPQSNPSGIRPGILVSDFPEVVEDPAQAGKQEVPAPPVGINGRIAASGEEDRFLLAVQPGSKLRVDVIAQRAGSPLDGVLSVQRVGGGQIAGNDDRPGTVDPGLDFQVPADTQQVALVLRDLHGRGGESFVYRITVAPQDQGDFRLLLDDDRINLPAGGTALVRLTVQRDGYQGPIELAFDSLPSGVTAEGLSIPAGMDQALVSLTAGAEAAGHVVTVLRGRAVQEGVQLTRAAAGPDSPLAAAQPWLRHQIAVATAPGLPLGVQWSSDDFRLLRGAKVRLPVRVQRGEGTQGPIRLSLLTTQKVPQIADGPNKGKPDQDRAIRLAEAVELAADQSEALLQVLVPVDLPETACDVALVAEVLSADKKQVLATAHSPARRFAPVSLLRLELSSAANIEAKAGGGPTGKFTGKVLRAEGFQQEVTLSLAGLPADIPAPTMTLGPQQQEFAFEVRFAAETKPQELKNLRLIATAPLDPGDTESTVQSNPVPVTVKVVAGEQTP